MKRDLRLVVVCGIFSVLVSAITGAQTYLPSIANMPDLNQPDPLILAGGGALPNGGGPMLSWPNYCAPVSAANIWKY